LDKKRFYIIARGRIFKTKNYLVYGKNGRDFNPLEAESLVALLATTLFELNTLLQSLQSKFQTHLQCQ
jgi:hypothetical protein